MNLLQRAEVERLFSLPAAAEVPALALARLPLGR
jgi:hypothetical protein